MPLKSLLFLPLLTCIAVAIPGVLYDVSAFGPQGKLGLVERLRDAVGTATQVWKHGPARRLTAINTLRSGPLSAVYRTAISSNGTSAKCETRPHQKCEVAIDGFGTVGEVHYEFQSARTNTAGRSTQVLVACVCLTDECIDAVLMRPINLFTRATNGSYVDSGKRTCLFEAVDGEFSDCHSELLRVSYRPSKLRPEYLREEAFNYSVVDGTNEFWDANGQRGWTRDCNESEVDALPAISMAELQKRKLKFNMHKTPPGNQCRAPPRVQYFRAADVDAQSCTEIYDHAAAAAAHIATQQDEIATANMESSYKDEKPPLLEDTELALICSAAGLGVLFVWSRYRKKLRPADNSVLLLVVGVVGQVAVLYVLEALPLHTALGGELRARDWSSLFSFVDATLVLGRDQTGPQGSAVGSVVVLTAVLGEVRYTHTREALVAALTALFDLAAVVIIFMTVVRKVRFIVSERRKAIYELGDDGSSASCGSSTPRRLLLWRHRGRRGLRRGRGRAPAVAGRSPSSSSDGVVAEWKKAQPAFSEMSSGGLGLSHGGTTELGSDLESDESSRRWKSASRDSGGDAAAGEVVLGAAGPGRGTGDAVIQIEGEGVQAERTAGHGGRREGLGGRPR